MADSAAIGESCAFLALSALMRRRHLICCGSGVTCDRISRSTTRERVSDSPTMRTLLRLCRKCGAQIPADAPEEGCPGCLLEAGLGLSSDPSVATTVVDPGLEEALARDEATGGHRL
jgi:hypothetical protein